jgi:hypothetical protein
VPGQFAFAGMVYQLPSHRITTRLVVVVCEHSAKEFTQPRLA